MPGERARTIGLGGNRMWDIPPRLARCDVGLSLIQDKLGWERDSRAWPCSTNLTSFHVVIQFVASKKSGDIVRVLPGHENDAIAVLCILADIGDTRSDFGRG
jgi:hypothetical protein